MGEHDDKLGEEIDDLLEGLGSLEEEEETPGEETPVEEETPPAEETPPVEEEGETPPPVEEETPPEGEDVSEDKDKLINQLRKTVNELSGGRIAVDDGGHVTTTPTGEGETPKETPKPVQPDAPIEIERLQFIKEDDDLDDILEDSAKLNELLNLVLQKAVELSVPAVHQRTLQSIPSVVHEYSKRRGAVNEIVGAFYNKNEDLVPFKKAVAVAANAVHSENPDWDYEAVFNEAAKRTRQSLGLKAKVAANKNTNKSKNTGLSRKHGGGRSTQRLTGVSAEINDFEGL